MENVPLVRFLFLFGDELSFLNIGFPKKIFKEKIFWEEEGQRNKACKARKADCTVKDVSPDDVVLLSSRRDNIKKWKTYLWCVFFFCFGDELVKMRSAVR